MRLWCVKSMEKLTLSTLLMLLMLGAVIQSSQALKCPLCRRMYWLNVYDLQHGRPLYQRDIQGQRFVFFFFSLSLSLSLLGCASGCVVECRICNREVAGSNLSLGYFAPRSTQPSIPPGSVNEYQLRLGRQKQVWLVLIADERVGVPVKLWNPLRTRAIPERFCGGDSLRRGAISSVCTFTFTISGHVLPTSIFLVLNNFVKNLPNVVIFEFELVNLEDGRL